jgi:TPR repeat protein
MAFLGFAYQNGEGVGSDQVAAKRWYKRAAALGEVAVLSSPGGEAMMYGLAEGRIARHVGMSGDGSKSP